jgi:hypothetical protein
VVATSARQSVFATLTASLPASEDLGALHNLQVAICGTSRPLVRLFGGACHLLAQEPALQVESSPDTQTAGEVGMERLSLAIRVWEGTFAVCRLGADEHVPAWASAGQFCSITRTPDELSVVCAEECVPQGVKCERGWRCLRVGGAIEFSVVGVLASLAVPLAEAGISIFAVSTFDTDYLLVKAEDLPRALEALRSAGHVVQ